MKESPLEDNPQSIKIGEQTFRIAGAKYSIPAVALMLMLAAVLVPTVNYSLNLQDPTPAELLVAICIALFSSVVFLWILDATSILRFRSEWVSKSVYGAAIASVLGTSVAVYQDAFSERKYKHEGSWEIELRKSEKGELVAKNTALLIYSENAGTYYGFSNYNSSNEVQEGRAVWIEISDFDPKEKQIKVLYYSLDGKEYLVVSKLKSARQERIYKSSNGEGIYIELSRPK